MLTVVVVRRGGQLLVMRRSPERLGYWSVVAGGLEPDETSWHAAVRELREETGLEVSRGRLAAMDFRRPRPGRAGGIRFLFDCGRLSDEALAGVKLQPEEISESRLVPGSVRDPVLSWSATRISVIPCWSARSRIPRESRDSDLPPPIRDTVYRPDSACTSTSWVA